MTKPKLLLTGASGFLGWNICLRAHDAWRVIGVVNAHRVTLPYVRSVQIDLTDKGSIERLLDAEKPDAVIHAAALSSPDLCQHQPDLSRRINRDAAVDLAGFCAERDIHFLFTSTDLVFDGRTPPYAEDDPANPVSVYAVHKVAAEQGILQCCPNASICRMPLMFGDGGPLARGFLAPLAAALREGREVKLFEDEFRTPVGGASAARGILTTLECGVKGILHLGGRERVSRLAFGALVAGVLGCNARVTPVRQADVATPAPRPPDVSLDSSRAFALGYGPLPIEEELRMVLAGRIVR